VTKRPRLWRTMVALLTLLPVAATADLSAPLRDDLAKAKYVYISTERKDGTFGKPAEIWFLVHQGSVYVASPPGVWRVRRIKAGRPNAKIAVDKPDGPSFDAKGEISKETSVHPILFETFAKKYADGWPRHEKGFRDGLKDGSRVLIRYVPK